MPNNFSINNKGFNAFGELIGLNFSRTEKGTSRCTLEVTGKLFNPHKVVHGGVIYSMADTGMGVALFSDLEEDESCTTIEIKIAYFKAVMTGSLVCDSKIIHRSKRIASLESQIKNDNRLVAKAAGTFYILRR